MSALAQNLGRAVQARRKALSLTQESLAERADLSPSYIRMIEMGARSPSLDVLEQVAVALSTSAAALLSAGDESADVAAPLLGFIRSRRLDADDVQRLEHVARAMFALQEVSRG